MNQHFKFDQIQLAHVTYITHFYCKHYPKCMTSLNICVIFNVLYFLVFISFYFILFIPFYLFILFYLYHFISFLYCFLFYFFLLIRTYFTIPSLWSRVETTVHSNYKNIQYFTPPCLWSRVETTEET